MSWTYKVDKGVTDLSSGQRINFDAFRDDIRKKFKYDPIKNIGRFENEDSYENINSSGDWIRLSFDKQQKLKEIEILSGTVYFDDKEIKIDGDLRQTIEELEKRGTKFIQNDYGYVSREFKFDLGDSEKSGGENNKINWFYTSTDVDHLLE
ncbi:MAG: hypothetical protein J0L67_18510 [Cytophagales bacterium]|nr:hypothetical protein [Cytophagales bacterium]